MAIRGICWCDVEGCPTRPRLSGTTLMIEADAVLAGWEVVAGIVRCPACVAAERWPTATVGTHPDTLPTTVPWIDGLEQGTSEHVLGPATYQPDAASQAAEYRVVTDDDLEI